MVLFFKGFSLQGVGVNDLATGIMVIFFLAFGKNREEDEGPAAPISTDFVPAFLTSEFSSKTSS